MMSSCHNLSKGRFALKVFVVIVALWRLTMGGWAQSTNIYHTNRVFQKITFTNFGIPTAYEVTDMAGKLTSVVGPTNVITNSFYVTEGQRVVLSDSAAEQAWAALVARYPSIRFHFNKYYDNVGWVKGLRQTRDGSWGGYIWTMQNTVFFRTSAGNTWVSPEGMTNGISRVLVGTIGDYGPNEFRSDTGPALEGLTNNPPSGGSADNMIYAADFTAYYELANLPVVYIEPLLTNVCVNSGNVTFSLDGASRVTNGVTWSIIPDGLTNGAALTGYASNAVVVVGGAAMSYVVRATANENTNIYGEAVLNVFKVESIEASCPIATNSPQVFEGHKTDFGDPCSRTATGQTLIVYYDAAVDANFQVQNFDVTLKAKLFPTTITAAQLGESWEKVEGPNSGSLNRTDTFEVKYRNPKEGGLYKFEFALDLSGCSNSGANVLLPLAGADMTSWLDTEAKAIGGWAIRNKAEVEDANDSSIPGVTLVNVINTWITISAGFFDYIFDPVDANRHSPCRRFQPLIGFGGNYGYITVNGVVVHGSKINNMLWALFGRYWGWPELSLKTGAHLNQLARTKRIDGSASQNAIGFADDIHTLLQSNPLASITNVLTPTALRMLQDPNSLIEEKLWPSPNALDTGNSTLRRPELTTRP